MKLMHGDCIEKMQDIESGSIDLILTDIPYGTTACKWDSIIPLEPMWEQLKRLIKKRRAIVLFSAQPFTTTLIASNLKMFKYEWIWEKDNGTNYASVRYQPFRVSENICVFGDFPITHTPGAIKCYRPQMTPGSPYVARSGRQTNTSAVIREGSRDKMSGVITENKGERFPRNIIKFKRDKDKLHPTQKPVALLEYLIKTYTNEGDTVLDFTMGSGSTGVACLNTDRDFIGIEKDDNYFQVAKNRIEQHLLKMAGI